jgi:tripartite ATP-independent transporter DctM subunit
MLVHRLENAIATAVFAAMALLALLEVAGRALLGAGVPGSIVLVQHLTLWVALVGAGLAARSNSLLALSTPLFFPARFRSSIELFPLTVATAITASLCLGSLDVVRIERGVGDTVAWNIPSWIVIAVLPAGFAIITARLIWRPSALRGRLLVALGLLVPAAFAAVDGLRQDVVPAALVAVIAATALGMPVVATIGGTALLFFWADGTPLNAVPGETYRLTTSPMLPAIPLFALGGYVLAAGRASQRMTRLFSDLFGWLPGGLAIVITLVLAFFTPLTGASGVTILSMGGLLLPVLVGARYSERTSIGLVTVSGSIGLLFFPSLPVFLYAFYANVPFERIFIGGLLPGILLVTVVAGWAAARGWLTGAVCSPFEGRRAAASVWEAKWELLLPAVVLGGIVTGLTTLVEAAALGVLYAVFVECVVHRELGLIRDVPRVTVECATLVGGFMVILAMAFGLTNYLVIADVPTRILGHVHAHIESPIVFLLALNGFLIAVGALMDIYSAVVVVVPLMLPVAAAYGIDPLHLAVIFLANMELGYLMPPMGENLFLSSSRFNRPLTEIYRSTLPYTGVLLAATLVITFVPGLSLWLVELLERFGYLQ